jgi:hypothetical protein
MSAVPASAADLCSKHNYPSPPQTLHLPGATVLLCSDPPPVPLGAGRWKISVGTLFLQLDGPSRPIVVLDDWSSLAYAEVTYSISKGALVVMESQWNMRTKSYVPFIRRRYSVSHGRAQCRFERPLPATRSSEKRLRRLFRVLAESEQQFRSEHSVDEVESVLTEILAEGGRAPEAALRQLQKLRRSWWNDGDVGETYQVVETDLKRSNPATACRMIPLSVFDSEMAPLRP